MVDNVEVLVNEQYNSVLKESGLAPLIHAMEHNPEGVSIPVFYLLLFSFFVSTIYSCYF